MESVINNLIQNQHVRLGAIIVAVIIALKLLWELLKVSKVVKNTDKSPLGALYSLLFKKSYIIKQARRSIKQKDYLKAGLLYEEIGNYSKALEIYNDGQEYDQAGELFEKLKNDNKAIENYKKSGNIDKIIELYLKHNNFEAAGIILEDNNRSKEAAEIYFKHGQFNKAALIFEKKGFYRKAGYIYEKAGNFKKAAQNFENWFLANADTAVGFQRNPKLDADLHKAVELYVRLGEYKHAYDLLLKNNDFEKAAEIALKLEQYDEAAQLYEKAQNLTEAAKIYEKNGKKDLACQLRGEHALAQGNTPEAAEWLLKGKDYTRAAELFEWNSSYDKAAYCYFMNQNYISAADNYLKVNNEEEACKMYELGREWKTAADLSFKHDKFQKAGELYEKSELFHQAGISFLRIEDLKRALSNFQKVKKDDPEYNSAISHMAEIFLKNRKPQLVIEKIGQLLNESPLNKQNIDWYYLLGQAHENAGNYKDAHSIYQRILTENYSYKDIHQRIKAVESLIAKFREMDMVSEETDHRYKILKKVGEGGMGVVFRAEDTVLKRIVALKVLSSGLINDRRNLERFYSEARSTASLSHANIVTVYDVGQLNGDYFISMEFIEGENFMTLIRKQKGFTIPQIIFIAIKIFKALNYSHKQGVVHRDIKPHNIMITRQKEIKIMDFGLAIIRGDGKNSETGIITGTPLLYVTRTDTGSENRSQN